MFNWLKQLDRHVPVRYSLWLLCFVGAMLCGIFAIVGGILLKIRKENVGASLKQNMLDRGMSAEDIKTVMEAGTEKGKKCG